MADQSAEDNALQGFNEDELKDIMSEIESLEKESMMEGAPAEKSEPTNEAITESELSKELGLNDSSSGPDLQEVVDDQVKEVSQSAPAAEVQEEEPVQAVKEEAEVTQIHKPEPKPVSTGASNAPASMSFDLSGQLNMSLNFSVGNKSFAISLDDKNGVVLKLQDGMTFTIPMDEVKKAS